MSQNIQPIKQTTKVNYAKSSTHENQKAVINFNSQIEPTKQSHNQIDCWLLSTVNGLNSTDWGKKIIKNAINPDKMGGVNITFKGSPLKQKTFNIAIGELEKAKESGNYSSGDDDMLALELATEKLFKMMIKEGNGKWKLANPSGYKGTSSLGNMKIDEKSNINLGIDELLTGIKPLEINFEIDGKNLDNILKYAANNPGKYALTCNFSNIPDATGTRAKNDIIHGNHLYSIKKIIFGKKAIITDPYDSSKEINLPWNKFKNELGALYASPSSPEDRKQLKNHLPEGYEAIIAKDLNDRLEYKKKLEDEEKAREKAYKKQKTDLQVEDICSKLNELTYGKLANESTIKLGIESIDKDNVIQVLKNSNQLITKLDEYRSGWGNGQEKKALIEPIINALAQRAREIGITRDKVENFKKICIEQELNAIFYTNEKVISSEVQNMQKLIERASNK